MRTLMIVVSLVGLAAPLAARDLPVKVAPQACRPGADKASGPRQAGPQKLGDLPPAQEIKAVWRTDARGCPDPIVVRAFVGQRR